MGTPLRKDTRETIVGRLRTILKAAAKASDNPRSQPSVQHTMLQSEFLLQLDSEVKRHLMAIGLAKEIREFFKDEDERNGAATKEQTEMWPKACRSLVAEIDRERVFVPSLGEFVPLLPDEITKAQTREAGVYLIEKGTETIRVGKLLCSLAKKL